MSSAKSQTRAVASIMSSAEKKRPRKSFGKSDYAAKINAMAPSLLDSQLESYKTFLQYDINPEKRANIGLEAALKAIFPIASFSDNARLEYVTYTLGEPVFDVRECQLRGLTYSAPLRIRVRLVTYEKDSVSGSRSIKDVKEQEVYMGDIPLMTATGSFVINGIERVVVSQLHRSPGVYFENDKGKTHSSGKILFSARVIPYRGSWLDFEFDPKDCIHVRIDRRRKLPGTVILRALGLSNEDILDTFFEKNTYHIKGENVKWDLQPTRLRGEIAINDIKDNNGNVIVEKGRRISPRHIQQIQKANIKQLEFPLEYIVGKVIAKPIVDPDTGEVIASVNTEVTAQLLEQLIDAKIESIYTLYVNELDRGLYISDTLRIDTTTTQLEALVEIYRMMRPGQPPTKEAAENLFNNLFFSADRYDLSSVGRMKFNIRLGRKEITGSGTLSKEDIIDVIKTLVSVRDGKDEVDDIDNLGNRRVRCVGEMVENQFRLGLMRVERVIKERLGVADSENLMPQDLLNAKPVVAAFKEFFGTSQLSQFMDQNNPLSEITHKRRVSSLGPGGLSRERAGFEVRDVHTTQYGRICPIETPEGPNIGLINSLAFYAKINSYGFLESPYRKIIDGKVTDIVEYLSAIEENQHYIAQANTPIDIGGNIIGELIPCRHKW